jgi:hypothetical protein
MMDYVKMFLPGVPENADFEKTWGTRPKSKLVRYMLWWSMTPRTNCEERLGISRQYFDNKLSRNSWSFEDILAIADECGFEFTMNWRG